MNMVSGLTPLQKRLRAKAHRLSLQKSPRLTKADLITLAESGYGVRRWQSLSGGAIHHHWRIHDMRGETYVMRAASVPFLPFSHALATQARIMKHFYEYGLPVPLPVHSLVLPSIGQTLIMKHHKGIAKRRFSKREGNEMAPHLARLLAHLHGTPPLADLPLFDPLPVSLTSQDKRLAALASQLKATGILSGGDRVMLHGDFRTGNYLVHRQRIQSVLDFEFSALGPREADLGWLSLPAWLYGANDRAGAGMVTLASFIALYEQASGVAVSRQRVMAWRIAACLRWGGIARWQDRRLNLPADSCEPLSPLLNQAEDWLSIL